MGIIPVTSAEVPLEKPRLAKRVCTLVHPERRGLQLSWIAQTGLEAKGKFSALRATIIVNARKQ